MRIFHHVERSDIGILFRASESFAFSSAGAAWGECCVDPMGRHFRGGNHSGIAEEPLNEALERRNKDSLCAVTIPHVP